jgi:hypothetical protein
MTKNERLLLMKMMEIIVIMAIRAAKAPSDELVRKITALIETAGSIDRDDAANGSGEIN